MHYAFFLEHLYVSFQFCFVLFAAINGWTPTNFFFTLIVQRVFSFSTTTFSFRFLPWFLFRSCYIFASSCILTSGPCWFSSNESFQKGLNAVWKEKKFHTKKWYKKELV
jgi:hypothetical protein